MSEPTPATPSGAVPPDARHWSRTPWRTTSTRPIYDNPWISVHEDQVELPDGRTTIYGVVECAECVGILPLLDRERRA